MQLTDKVVIPNIDPSEDDPESYLYDSLGTIFPDDTWNQHGDPGSSVTYKSSRFGDIKLNLADPQGEDGRKLFAHFVWNAGIWLAEAISSNDETEKEWDVKGESVIELGAGGCQKIVPVYRNPN
jgi:nicotinamide N-methyltransferase